MGKSVDVVLLIRHQVKPANAPAMGINTSNA